MNEKNKLKIHPPDQIQKSFIMVRKTLRLGLLTNRLMIYPGIFYTDGIQVMRKELDGVKE